MAGSMQYFALIQVSAAYFHIPPTQRVFQILIHKRWKEVLMHKKNIHTCLIVFFLVLLSPYATKAELPSLTGAIDEALYKGTDKEIIAAIDKHQKIADRLISEVKDILSQSPAANTATKTLITNTLDALQGLSFQLTRLKSEVKRPVDFPFNITAIGPPPYPLEIFENRIDLLYKIEQKLSEGKQRGDNYDEKIDALKNDLESLFLKYTKLKATRPNSLAGYEKLARILSLQVEYALLQTKRAKNEKKLSYLTQLHTKDLKQIKGIFDNLKITKQDIEKAKKEREITAAKEKKAITKLDKEYRQASKSTIVSGIRLDNIIKKLSSKKLNKPAAQLLRAEKDRLEIIIKGYQIKQQYINQQKLALKIKGINVSFQYDWITTYTDFPEAKRPAKFIETSVKLIDDLRSDYEHLTQRLIETSRIKSDLVKKMTELKNYKENISKRAIYNISSQLYKTVDLTDSLFLKTTENKYNLKRLKNRINCIVNLMRNRATWLDRFQVWSQNYLYKGIENLKGIAYYPLITLGNTNVTLISILKVIFLFFAGITILKIIRKKLTSILFKKAHLSYGAVNSITTLGYYASLVLVALIAMSTAGLDLSQLSIILGALGVGIGFGLQTIANNFISGLILLTERSIRVGDIVNIGDNITGEVKNLAIRATIIRTYDGEDIIVPNSEFVSNRVRTWTYGDDWRRLKIRFGVSYDADPDKVRDIAIDAAREVKTTIEDEDHPIRIRFEGFGDNSLDFSIRVWCRMTRLRAYSGLISDYYFVLFKKLKEADIEIPFPQRDVHLRSVSADILKFIKTEEE